MKIFNNFASNGNGSSRKEYISFLRGVAILLVIGVHTSQSIPGLDGFAKNIFDWMQVGVQLFFMLSAYTLCMSFSRSSNLYNYFIKRLFRIAPVYFLIGVVGYVCLDLLKNIGTEDYLSEVYSLTNILANAFLVHSLFPEANNTIVPGGWSIAAEVAFYAIFPFLFFWIYGKEKRMALFYLSTVFVPLFFILFLSYSVDVSRGSFFYYSLLSQINVFFLGMVCFYLKDRIVNKLNSLIILLLSIMFLIFSFLSGWVYDEYFIAGQWFTVVFSGFGFFFLILFFRNADVYFPSWIMKMGEYSFSIYLTHFIFAHYMLRIVNKLIEFDNQYFYLFVSLVFVVVFSYFSGSLLYKYIEIWFMKSSKRFIR